jgi:hypothetical protein
VDADLPADHVLLRAADGERDDATGHADGRFLRVEDTHAFGSFALALGAGSSKSSARARPGS